jgi:hypothetical protein
MNFAVRKIGMAMKILTTRLCNYALLLRAALGVHMRKVAAIVAVIIAGYAFSARPASAQVCAAGILFAALYANATENRELSAKEAATCGLFFGADRDKAVKAAPAPKKPAPKTAAKKQQ